MSKRYGKLAVGQGRFQVRVSVCLQNVVKEHDEPGMVDTLGSLERHLK